MVHVIRIDDALKQGDHVGTREDDDESRGVSERDSENSNHSRDTQDTNHRTIPTDEAQRHKGYRKVEAVPV